MCIAGLPGSGKSTAAEIFKENGFRVIEMSSLVKASMKEHKIEVNIGNIVKYAHDWRAKMGNDIVARTAIKQMKSNKSKNFIVSGVRSTSELKAFREYDSTLILLLTSPQAERYKRVRKRAEPKDPKSRKEFLEREKSDARGYEKHKRITGIDRITKEADIIIANTSTKAAFRADVLRAAKYIKKLC